MSIKEEVHGKHIIVPENPVSRFLFSDTRSGLIWLVIRLYLGYEWIHAGWGKLNNSKWVGSEAGVGLTGFINGALGKAQDGGDVTGWYADFLENAVLPNAKVFSYFVACGEFLVGLGLILGLLTGVAAFFGAFMNAAFLFAGTLSSNPLLFILATWLVLAWKVAGWYGLDRWALPILGTPWSSRRRKQTP
ncbi:DoxX family membrane protein [Cohnella lubricantis]|uniref:DoxX family membrane protein n=1 Tax=Cohnella lubricantis TaxID=2163172 RepID=A0A841T436_9BACL|nr:DoxX family membrane protein [Cohnella lubricantis]MBB6676333.1 DoxX family membrane protein [Cohnella lubricantis]MBP2120298.1 thiosulfate dehydrogenase [quinone] large subunit [Cohnella lubricantis]